MKILFVMRNLGRGGAERQLTELAKGLQYRKHQVTVAVFYGGGSFEAELISAGVTIAYLEKKSFWDVFGFLWRYSKLLKKINPDVLHGYMPMQNLLTSLGRFLLPNTKIVWGLRDSNIGLGSIPVAVRIIFKLSCWLSSSADLIISNSETGRLFHVSKGYPVDLIKVVPNGIDTKKFSRNEKGREFLRREWGVSSEHILIGNVSRLDPKKDHATFLQACAILLKNNLSIKIAFIGEHSALHYRTNRTELELLAKDLHLDGHLIWAGEYTDMASCYSSLDLEVSSSLYEGFPNVVAESMSCGIPVVATDAGDIKIMLADIGICVPINNPTALANGITEMLQKNLSDIGRRGRERIIEKYSVDMLVNRTENLLKGLLNNN